LLIKSTNLDRELLHYSRLGRYDCCHGYG